ncbi:hypothetical protein PC9H_011019 [Pleurotus ostreatus]|uniref:Class I hydrophobin 21 n=3 Tax=Pleurotus TaxID=5320 RepID=HYD21_PLEO1|nr:uncharacterized protein PC9H_011019 [Pleurotus ostreatus]KAF7422856.1 hypothetical protein PC9H_011019 [Pleurotus ostreatus]KAG9227296.1 hypothetical protein CCMSSC00406_0004165 [Pleurotus cornucopiae]KAJ8691186.1 hypothetical protein PTI98_010780 [Pleurotus ostreatus]KDQ25427.1 class I hydrophobin superfamily [Pleurotus ostreatus PC15]
MFAAPATMLVLAALAALSSAIPAAQTASKCSTGPVQCCDSVEHHTQPHVNNLLLGLEHFGLVKGLVGGLTGNVGIKCNPILLSSNDCTAQSVCCEHVHFKGNIAVGCTPANIDIL